MREIISYKLESFEGPLDLLLHLIEKDKINIYDIPIADITRQYMEYVSAMETEDLNIMSDFLVMAATLLDIKAKMLLPKEVDPETGEELDPREELVQRLIEYKKYKIMAKELQDLLVHSEKRLYKDPTIPKEVSGYTVPVDLDELLGDMNLAGLQKIFEQVLRRKDDRIDPQRSRFGTIKKEKISLEERIGSLITFTKEHKKFSFRKLLEEQRTRLEVVVTFLAVLELTKAGMLHITQDGFGEEMEIETVETENSAELDLSGLGDFEG